MSISSERYIISKPPTSHEVKDRLISAHRDQSVAALEIVAKRDIPEPRPECASFVIDQILMRSGRLKANGHPNDTDDRVTIYCYEGDTPADMHIMRIT